MCKSSGSAALEVEKWQKMAKLATDSSVSSARCDCGLSHITRGPAIVMPFSETVISSWLSSANKKIIFYLY